MEKRNAEKAKLIYDEIDRNKLFRGPVAKEDRSFTNACFVMEDPSLDAAFFQFADERGIRGIKGHRLSGGFRASLYNALPLRSVEVLVETMQDFEKLHS
jgi:phosphoserine aminotransferase